jgi:UDP-GlcNAc:undecaprenyl-phosphate/decaprenyl-phosphate GlcNAc-1-phosphate transferase
MTVSSLGLLAFCISVVSSLLLVIPVRALALHIGMVDLPGPRKVHLTPVPLLGGLAIYAGFLFAVLFTVGGSARAVVTGILMGATLVAFVGFLDDRGLLHHQVKLFGAMPLAAVTLLVTGTRAHVFEAILTGRTGVVLDTLLTLFWVVGITAAFSILDHMDGLCAGVAGVAALFFAILASADGQHLVTVLGAATLGSAAGFLVWNFKPAKIFMGDGGAMFLGFLMATLGLKLHVSAALPASWLVPVLFLGVPVFDTTLISISRTRRGLLPFATPGKDHTAHRLANLGFGQRNAVLTLYALGFAFGVLGLLTSRLSSNSAMLLGLAAAVASLGGVAALERAPYERQSSKIVANSSPPPQH